MKKNIEIEYKVLLTKAQYEQIKPYFQSPAYQQTNYYFDTKDEKLRKQRITLRSRLKNAQYEFTLKRNGANGLNEYNEAITKDDFNSLVKGEPINSEILKLLKEYDIHAKDLCQIYSLTTTRHDQPYRNGILSLDMSEYLGVIDYEIEFEVDTRDNAINDFNEFLAPFGITYKKNCKGKRHRLCDVLYGIKN